MEVIPAVDILGGRVVRLYQGDYTRATVYDEDPVAVAAAWVTGGASRVHVVDLEGARSGLATPGIVEALGAAGVPFQIGGGIRDELAARAAMDAGAERVVVGTAAVRGDPLGAIVDAVGRDSVVAAVDVRDGRSVGSGWADAGRSWRDVAADVVAAGVPRMLVTGVARDGTLRGPDLDLISAVQRAETSVALIASGGVGDLGDLERLAALGVEAVVVGRALYEERLGLEAAIAAARR